MADHLRPPRPGEAIEARPLRRFLERCNALAKLRVTGSVGPDRMDAKLSGAGAPYTCTEQAGTASGNWADRAGGRVVPCYELNAQTGLAGKVVPAWRDTAGVWRFEYARTGPRPPACSPCWPDSAAHPTLVLTYTYAGCSGYPQTVTTTLTYHNDDPSHFFLGYWLSPAQSPPDWSCYTSGGYVHPVFRLYCDGGVTTLRMEAFLGSAAACILAAALAGYSCSPLHLDFPTGACTSFGGIHATVTE